MLLSSFLIVTFVLFLIYFNLFVNERSIHLFAALCLFQIWKNVKEKGHKPFCGSKPPSLPLSLPPSFLFPFTLVSQLLLRWSIKELIEKLSPLFQHSVCVSVCLPQFLIVLWLSLICLFVHLSLGFLSLYLTVFWVFVSIYHLFHFPKSKTNEAKKNKTGLDLIKFILN